MAPMKQSVRIALISAITSVIIVTIGAVATISVAAIGRAAEERREKQVLTDPLKEVPPAKTSAAVQDTAAGGLAIAYGAVLLAPLFGSGLTLLLGKT